MTVTQFLEWADGQDEGRYELLYGQIVAMAPQNAGHVRAKFATAQTLRDAIRTAQVPCEALTEGLAVVVDESISFLPDALVNCGPPVPGNQLVATNPVIVVEVLSPSTRHIDKSKKLLHYFRMPGLDHYLIVDLEHRAVIHHRRTGETTIQTTLLRSGPLRLDPPGLDLDVAGLFGEDAG